ncbi:MAG: ATP-binding protein [Cyanobacteria bacterium P01_D01_bin.115]
MPRRSPLKVPLSWVLVVPFVAQLIGVVGLVGYLSVRNGERTVEELAGQMIHEVCQRTGLRLRSYFAQPLLINQINANAVKSGQLDLADLDAVEATLFNRLQEFKDISGILIGTTEGDFRAATRRGQLRLIANDDSQNLSQIQDYALSADGQRQSLIQSLGTKNVHQAPWYESAAQAGESVWSPVFQTGDDQNLSLNANLPIFDDAGELLGVASAGIVLSVIDEFLNDFRVSENGVIFVIDQDGLLLGSSTDSAIYDRQVQGGTVTLQRIHSIDSGHPLIRATATALTEQSLTASTLAKVSTLKVSYNDEQVFVEVAPFRDLDGLDLMIVVAVPERDLMGPLRASTRDTVYLSLGATGIAIALGLLTARWIARPVRRLSQASEKITAGEFDSSLPPSPIQEMDGLVSAFNQMSSDIQSYSTSLEDKVQERTAALEQEVCDRKQVEAQLAHAKTAAETASRAKSAFLASMSHELRTPLNAILGFTQLMSCQGQMDERNREYLDIINQSGNHLLTLINNVLDMSKIEANCLEAHYTSVNIPELVHSLADMFTLKAESKHVALQWRIDSEVPPYLCTDDSKLRQILTNLLANAIRFTDEGQITLQVGVQSASPDPAELAKAAPYSFPDRQVYFEIKDTGIGMTAAEIDQIFAPFTQTAAGQLTPGGTGLGLTISQQFAQLLGGQIEVQSQPGDGSQFRLVLPAWVVSEPEAHPLSLQQAYQQLSQFPPCRLLIAEDQPENRYLLQQLLTIPNLELRQVENGQACLKLWETWEPHIILMDLSMPMMDGYEATRQIKATPQGQATVVIAITSYAFEENRRAAIEAGCDDFIRKPIEIRVLLQKLLHHLGETPWEGLLPPPTSAVDATTTMTTIEAAVPLSDWRPLSIEWIKALRHTAYACNEEQVIACLKNMPAEQSRLRQQLTKLATAFQFDRIIELSEAALEQQAAQGTAEPNHSTIPALSASVTPP